MKTLIAVLAAFLFVNNSLYSQGRLKEKPDNSSDEYFSVSYGLGFIYSGLSNALGNVNRFGQNGSIELAFHSSRSGQVFLSGSSQKLIASGENKSALYLNSVSVGLRYFVSQKKNIFVEVSGGPHFLNSSYRTFYWYDPMFGNSYYRSDNLFWGVSAGAGKEISLSKSVSINFKAVLRNIFTSPGNITLFGLYGSAMFNSKETDTRKPDAPFKSYFGLSALGGISNPDFFTNQTYEWGGSYGIEAALRYSPKMEIAFTITNNRFVQSPFYYSGFEGYTVYEDRYKYHALTIELAQRFFMNSQKLSAFVEMGGGACLNYYYFVPTGIYHYDDEPSLSMVIGTGLIYRVYRNLSIVVTPRAHYVFDDYSSSLSFLTVNSGLRLDL